MAEGRPRVLAVLPAFFPSTIICVAKPLERLHGDGRIALDLTLQFAVTRRRVEQADVVVLCHSIDPRFAAMLGWIRDAHKGLIHDLDDNLLDAPADIPGLGYLREPGRREALESALRQADVVRVYSPSLQQAIRGYTDCAELVSGPLDWSLVPGAAPARDPEQVRIVYATSRRQDRVGEMVIAPLRQVLDAHPNVTLTVWGPRLDALAHPRTRFLPFERDYDRYFARFAREGFDIGLAPLPDDVFHRGKSNLKFREYAACGVVGVYSDMPVYNTTVVNGETGLLVGERPDAWRDAIARLVTDGELRRRIAGRARTEARAAFNEARTDADWMRAIDALTTRARQATPSALPPPARPAAGVTALARQAAWLAGSVPRVLAQHGARATADRAVAHLAGWAQLMMWKRQHPHRAVPRATGRGHA